MSNLLENFLKNVYVRTKHIEKSCVGLWGQSLIIKAVKAEFLGLKEGYMWRVVINKELNEVSFCEVS